MSSFLLKCLKNMYASFSVEYGQIWGEIMRRVYVAKDSKSQNILAFA